MNKRIMGLALAAIVGLVAAMPAAGVARSGQGPDSVAVKSKCGKKKKRKKVKKGAAAAKECRKKKKIEKPDPIVLPGPLVRGSVTWAGAGIDVDLHAYDANGAHSGLVFMPDSLQQNIPNSSHSGDVQTAGSEKFTDNAFLANAAATREFAYVVCFNDDGSSATFTGVTKSGASTSIPITGDEGDYSIFSLPGGPSAPAVIPC
jgi:hypothetical protein